MDIERDGVLENGQEKIPKPVSRLQFFAEGVGDFVVDILDRGTHIVGQRERDPYFEELVHPLLLRRKEANSNQFDYDIIEERIILGLNRAEESKKTPLTDFEVQFLAHFWEQHLRRSGVFPTVLKYTDPERNFYPALHKYTGVAQKMLHHFVANYDEVRANFDQIAPEIQEILQDTSLVMVMNHDAWTTQMLSSLLAHEGLKDFPVDRNSIILGPALLTASQWGILDPEKGARSVSSIYSTIPDTPNGRPEDLNQRKLQSLAGRTAIKVMGDLQEGSTKIVHLSPSATTDIKNSDGTFTMKTVGEGTAHFLVKILNELKIPVCLVGMNHNGMYANGKLRKEPVYIQFGPIIRPGELTGTPREITDHIMDLVAQNVRDGEGRQIGRYEKVN